MSANTNFRKPSEELVPVALVRALVALVLISLAITTFAVVTDRPLEAMPPESPAVIERTLFIEGDMSGGARVLDETGSLISAMTPEEGGFVSGVWRVLQRERTNARVPLDGPVRLVGTENGRVAIFDPSTGWRADLMGFGADNAAAFAALLR